MAEPLPRRLRDAMAEIANDETMNDGIEALSSRTNEFTSTLAARLTGVALNPAARLHFEKTLDEMWSGTMLPTSPVPEIIVGSGLHTAIYCAVRASRGHPKPVVIEAKERAGGTFAASQLPAFYLNSINRPGIVGIPGREEGLNYLPGAIIQPADLGIAEYQVNTDLAFAIRANLALYARVLTGRRVDRQLTQGEPTGVLLTDGTSLYSDRVIWATGLGAPRRPAVADGKSLMDYMEFLGHLDQRFPLQGIKSVAVVGAGDSGRTVIEALVGQGPANRSSVASLDWVDKIDWYGVEQTCMTRDGWANNNRSRYKGIARVLPAEVGGPSRVTPITRRAEQFGVGFDGAYVDGARYDLVVLATGFDPQTFGDGGEVDYYYQYSVGGRIVARAAGLATREDSFIVGPASRLETSGEANVIGEVLENTAAVWRYADRTASLAMALDATAAERAKIEKRADAPDEESPKSKRRLRRSKAVQSSRRRDRTRFGYGIGDSIGYGTDFVSKAVVIDIDNTTVKVRENKTGNIRTLGAPDKWKLVS